MRILYAYVSTLCSLSRIPKYYSATSAHSKHHIIPFLTDTSLNHFNGHIHWPTVMYFATMSIQNYWKDMTTWKFKYIFCNHPKNTTVWKFKNVRFERIHIVRSNFPIQTNTHEVSTKQTDWTLMIGNERYCCCENNHSRYKAFGQFCISSSEPLMLLDQMGMILLFPEQIHASLFVNRYKEFKWHLGKIK